MIRLDEGAARVYVNARREPARAVAARAVVAYRDLAERARAASVPLAPLLDALEGFDRDDDLATALEAAAATAERRGWI